ncbi:MAG: ABC transporter ATP-binding protein [Acidilobaceae archaeon]
MSGLLKVEALKVYYRLSQGVVKAVDDVSFSLEKGEVLGIAGESGSGKSTLAMALAGLLRPPAVIESGRIIFDGLDLTKLGEDEWRKLRGRRISVIFQDPSTYLNPVYTSGFQVAEVYEAHRGGRASRYMELVKDLYRKVKMADPERRVHSYPHQMSGGMKQRVLISIAIAEKPDLIIADEPTSALDVTIQAEIMELLKELKEETGSSIIFITHDLALLLEIADRIMIMYAGKMVELSGSSEIKEKPLHPYTRGLLGVLKPERKQKLASIPGSIPSLIDPPRGCRFHPRCPMAMPECSRVEPKMVKVNGRMVSCLLYEG